MKNKIYFILFLLLSNNLNAENLSITAKNVTLDKEKNLSIFKNDVVVVTKNKTLKSELAEYDRENGLLVLKQNVSIKDEKNNIMQTNYAEFFEKDEIIKTVGFTEIFTLEKYKLKGQDLYIDNKIRLIKSDKESILEDIEGNVIKLENFEYSIENSFFKSVGLVEVKDVKNNKYEFSQVYIDTKKKEILGADSKSFLNSKVFKINEKNNPRVFSNTIKITKEKSTFDKSIFTLCQYRANDKCPPWVIQSKKMLHDNKKKTIYYDNAIIKVYNIPIFYFPKLSHPDPTVERRSGFLVPSTFDTKNLGTGISIPYFFDLAKDKNFTFTNRVYAKENPLHLGEYHQAFKKSNLLADFGYTEGYKKTSAKKRSGEKSHFFGKIVSNFSSNDNYENKLELNVQDVSNDKYLKLYKIESNLVDYNKDTLENSINFTQERENLFFGMNASVYESLKSNYEDKYEYILPELTLDKNLFSNEDFGTLGLRTNYKLNSYDTNKLTNFLVNDLNYESNNSVYKNFLNTKLLANLKNINYESKNVNIYKDDPTSEIFGSLGLLAEINLKKITDHYDHFLKPKILMRFAPGSMRKEEDGSRLITTEAFSMNRVSNINNYETGITSTIGFDYKIREEKTTKFDFSVAQIINEKENQKMADKTSLNEKLSDLVGSSSYQLSSNVKLNYDFSLDQNYQDFNYNEFGASYNYGSLGVNFDYLSENKHIGDQDYFKTELNVKNSDKGLFSFKTKRNLKTNSSEFYNLSYEYINDCLRAGLVYRREFYRDSELEPEDSLMFKITLSPFGSFDSVKLN